MSYFTKQTKHGQEVGVTNCEIVLPLKAVKDLDRNEIADLVTELAEDLEFIGGNDYGFSTIEETKQAVREENQKEKSKAIKQQLIRQRRSQFSSNYAQLTLMLIERDGYICSIPHCGIQEHLTVDHIMPLSKGGSDDLGNLRFLCRKHNSSKGDR